MRRYYYRPCRNRKTSMTESHGDADFRKYIEYYGHHFNEALADWASMQMKNANGKTHSWKVSDVKSAFERIGLPLPGKNTWGDATYAANMAYADYFGVSFSNELDCIKQSYADMADPDGYPGKIFNRWVSDMTGKGIEVPWHEFM